MTVTIDILKKYVSSFEMFIAVDPEFCDLHRLWYFRGYGPPSSSCPSAWLGNVAPAFPACLVFWVNRSGADSVEVSLACLWTLNLSAIALPLDGYWFVVVVAYYERPWVTWKICEGILMDFVDAYYILHRYEQNDTYITYTLSILCCVPNTHTYGPHVCVRKIDKVGLD
jgi:hypothetical protein